MKYYYQDRYLFEVRQWKNGFGVYVTNTGTGYTATATPDVCEQMEMAWPHDWQPYFPNLMQCRATIALDELAAMNGMTPVEEIGARP